MLPDLINRVYTTKPKKRDEITYPTTRVDLEGELKAQSFITRRQPSAQINFQRNIQTSQPAARFYDKKAIQSRIEARLMKGMGNDPFNNGNQEMNYQKVNQLMQNQHINMKVVTDNISRNILVYTPKIDGREKFKTNSYPESLKIIDQKIQKYKKALEEAIKQQQQIEKDDFYIQETMEQQQQPVVDEENFDFLTGIGLHKNLDSPKQEKQEEEEQEVIQDQEEEKKQEFVQEPKQEAQILNPYQYQFEQVRNAFSQIYEKYQNKISKAFIKKDQPKARMKRKNPKINITGKGNKVQKNGAPFDEVEHLMRIYNKEHIPCEPKILVPSFQSKKDNIANTVLAYLKDYKPLLSGNKQNIPKSIQGLLDVELEMLKTVEKEGAASLQKQNPYDGLGGGLTKSTVSNQLKQSQYEQKLQNINTQQTISKNSLEINQIKNVSRINTNEFKKDYSQHIPVQQSQYVFPSTLQNNSKQ
ncbi:hypothetical protein TTHERM_00670810 (macronuclear) [Tetrahymena thermophila SB210]|uniref:Uncharacterized protein n=1 Tax=Tetrahymena thermophila (strain SB210) TaxID=312017 RepID=I7LXT5_TETTS|nr:hypothetical protein TTHERM_00670810 [Tetrahymena thermophila SB210]EAS06157.2 hypothetical protein TTHERM_00670810 [Tetrahymena thermophila SB210]|eukprot:XP_001026402.2 hypothetical protein TTHERM_00670810 [Tetrahymena thermophila SB210]